MAKIHFIGGGQMAEAIIRALVKDEKTKRNDISVFDIDGERNRLLGDSYGVTIEPSPETALATSQLIVIAVRPQDELIEIVANIRKFAAQDTIIVSIVAGVTIGRLEDLLGEDRTIVRVIPNTLTDTGFGYSGVSLNRHAQPEQVDGFLNGFGKVLYLEEKHIDAFTGFGVAGPNYIYYFVEALIDAGVLAGLSRKQARQVALENLVGAATMLEKSGLHPRQLLDINNSPGGVGMHGLYELNNSNFSATIQRSVLAAVKRTTELGQEGLARKMSS